jgi:D-glycero-D-manno-heptose 1,7-bisphosphate phosphatase
MIQPRSGGLRPAVFMDRDGTLIDDVGYCGRPEDVRLLDGVWEALGELRTEGFALVVVSNQSGIGRGVITRGQACAVHERFAQGLKAVGIVLDAAEYCPHTPWNDCPCRKPKPGMLLRAAEREGIDLNRSFMIGDRGSDVQAGQRAGCATILFGARGGRQGADHLASNWAEVLGLIRDTRRVSA